MELRAIFLLKQSNFCHFFISVFIQHLLYYRYTRMFLEILTIFFWNTTVSGHLAYMVAEFMVNPEGGRVKNTPLQTWQKSVMKNLAESYSQIMDVVNKKMKKLMVSKISCFQHVRFKYLWQNSQIVSKISHKVDNPRN